MGLKGKINSFTAISRKVVEKSVRDNPERYCGWFWVHCSSMIFEKNGTRDKARDVCLRVLKGSNKSRFDSYSVRNSVLIISHITFRDCRAHIFSDNLSGIIEIAVFVEISHLESPVYFYFIFMVNVKLNWRDVILSTPGLHGSGQIFERTIFFYLCNLFTRYRSNSFTDCSTVYTSKVKNLHGSAVLV